MISKWGIGVGWSIPLFTAITCTDPVFEAVGGGLVFVAGGAAVCVEVAGADVSVPVAGAGVVGRGLGATGLGKMVASKLNNAVGVGCVPALVGTTALLVGEPRDSGDSKRTGTAQR